VNVFVTELVKFKTGGGQREVNKAEQVKMDNESSNIPKLSADELVQLQDQMRKVRDPYFRAVLINIFNGLFSNS